MAESKLFLRIRKELKQTIRLFLEELRREHPGEHFYALLCEVDVSGTYTNLIAGSEESLSRLVNKYVEDGYRAKSADVVETLRASLRWDAPGDDKDGWYWGKQEDGIASARAIDKAVEAGLIEEFDEVGNQHLRRLGLDALRELDSEGAFGTGPDREQMLIGLSCCEIGFAEDDEDVAELATVNPRRRITQLRKELAAAKAADKLLIMPASRPRKN